MLQSSGGRRHVKRQKIKSNAAPDKDKDSMSIMAKSQSQFWLRRNNEDEKVKKDGRMIVDCIMI